MSKTWQLDTEVGVAYGLPQHHTHWDLSDLPVEVRERIAAAVVEEWNRLHPDDLIDEVPSK